MSRYLDVLLFLAALTFGTALLLSSNQPTTDELRERVDNVFPAFSSADIQSITVESRLEDGSIESAMVRRDPNSADDHRYFLGASGTELADPAAILELLRTLEFATFERRLGKDRDLATLGFDQPELELRIEAGARSYRLVMGKEVPHGPPARYASVNAISGESTLGTVKESLFSHLRRGQQSFRNKQIFSLSRSETTYLSISHSTDSVELSADTLGFRLANPGPASPPSTGWIRADRKLVDLLFYHLSRSVLENFLDDEQATLSQEDAAANNDANLISIRQRGVGTEIGALLGGKCPAQEHSVIARRLDPQPVSGCIAADIASALLVSRSDLVDHSAVPLNSDEIDHVVVERGAKRLDILRQDAAYRLVETGRAIAKEAGDEFFAVFSDARLEPRSPPSRAREVGRVTIKGQALATAVRPDDELSNVEHTLNLILREAGEELFLERQDDGAQLLVPPWIHWAFSADDSWTKDRELPRFAPESIRRLTVKRKGVPPQTVVVRDGQYFFEDGTPADSRFTSRLIAALGNLKAARFVPTRPKPTDLELQVNFLSGDSQQDLWIGKRVRGGYLAWASFVDGTFVLPLGDLPELSLSLFDRSGAFLTPDTIQELTILVQGRTYSLARRAGELTPESGDLAEDLQHPLKDALLGIEVISTERKTAYPPPQRPSALFRGIRTSEAGGHSFEMVWGQPVQYDGDSVIPVHIAGDEIIYFISRRSADALLELL